MRFKIAFNYSVKLSPRIVYISAVASTRYSLSLYSPGTGVHFAPNMPVQDALHRHRTLLFLIGLEEQPSHPRIYRCYAAGYLIALVAMQIVVYLSLRDAHSVLDANEALTPGVILTLLHLKRALYVHNRQRTAAVMRLLYEMETSTRTAPVERALIATAVRTAGWLRAGALVSCQAVIVTRFGVSMLSLNGARPELMFPAVVPGDWRHNVALYLAYNWAQFVITLTGSCGLGSLDTFGPMMYLLLDAFMAILCGRVRRLGVECAQTETECLRELVECIAMHKKCVRIAKHVNRMFGVHYLFQFGACCIGLCTIVFIITQVELSNKALRVTPRAPECVIITCV